MRCLQLFSLFLLLSTVMSCDSDDGPCGPSQPCVESYQLQIAVRDSIGLPVGGLQAFGRTVLDSPLGPLVSKSTTGTVVSLQFIMAQLAAAQIDIFDVHGQRVRRLVAADEQRPSGVHTVVWDARDDNGAEVPGGFYRAVFTVFDSVETVLFSDAHEGFLNGTPVSMGETGADGNLLSTDMTFFPHLILGENHEMPLIAADGAPLGVFDLSGGTQILLRDGQGLMQWFDVQVATGRNELDLVWCPTCPVPLDTMPVSGKGGTLTRRVDVPDPIPQPQFGFTGFYPNPFN